MKKPAAFLFTLLTAMALAACTGSSEPVGTSAPAVGRTIEETGIHEDPAESSTGLVGNTADADAVNKDAQTGDTENEDNTMNEINILVAYFSATNTTEGVAEHIANGLGADLYEIVPEEAYTDADLNYNDDSSRSTIEMNDPSSRPAISGGVENMEQYDIVFIGYPIWWGEAPRIVSTFMESYDFSGKTLIPFCTSGGSGLGSSASNLAELTDGAQWLSGQRLGGGSSQDEVMEWVNGLGLAVSTE
ncbi:flavodoxin [Enterocloster citroniae]|uniref:flavodoxin n=1 Tax=Enterocloster citroniae TaxID=358743 RepID=UPI00349EDB9E